MVSSSASVSLSRVSGPHRWRNFVSLTIELTVSSSEILGIGQEGWILSKRNRFNWKNKNATSLSVSVCKNLFFFRFQRSFSACVVNFHGVFNTSGHSIGNDLGRRMGKNIYLLSMDSVYWYRNKKGERQDEKDGKIGILTWWRSGWMRSAMSSGKDALIAATTFVVDFLGRKIRAECVRNQVLSF